MVLQMGIIIMVFMLYVSEFSNGLIICYCQYKCYAYTAYDNLQLPITFTTRYAILISQNGTPAKTTVWGNYITLAHYGLTIHSDDKRELIASICAIGF